MMVCWPGPVGMVAVTTLAGALVPAAPVLPLPTAALPVSGRWAGSLDWAGPGPGGPGPAGLFNLKTPASPRPEA